MAIALMFQVFLDINTRVSGGFGPGPWFSDLFFKSDNLPLSNLSLKPMPNKHPKFSSEQ